MLFIALSISISWWARALSWTLILTFLLYAFVFLCNQFIYLFIFGLVHIFISSPRYVNQFLHWQPCFPYQDNVCVPIILCIDSIIFLQADTSRNACACFVFVLIDVLLFVLSSVFRRTACISCYRHNLTLFSLR